MGSIQFLGLASGTDWNSVIDQLVEIERRPLEMLYEQRSNLAFQQSVMGDINQQLVSFSTALSALRFESTFLSREVTSSNAGRVSAVADVGAAPGTYNIEISRLAQGSRATSGLDGYLYSKVANLSQTQTLGIASLTPYDAFQATRALSSTSIKDTLQAGTSGAEITEGDTITISGQLKDSTNVSGTFTFNDDETDTLERLATTIAQVFHGEIGGSIGSNGELTFIETDPSVAGDVTFDTVTPNVGLTFNDVDYSGSTLSFGTGNNVAGAGATSRRLVHALSFTQSGVLELNSATDLALLDQVTGTLDNGDIIRITGTESGGSSITTTDFTYTGAAGGQTISDLLTTISGAFTTANATYQNGKIVLTDTGTGTSSLSIQLDFVDQGATTSFELDDFTTAETGRDAAAQMISTGSFTVEGHGEHLLSGTDGKAGKIRGTTTLLDPSNTLDSYGVTEFDMLTIDVDNAAGGLGPVTITGISEYSTLQDLVDAINDQVEAVTAQLVDAGGNYRLEIVANEGGRDIRVYDVANGVLDKLVSTGATDLDSSTNDLSNTFGATTDTDDITMMSWFMPDNGGPMQRFIWTGDEGASITGLIGGVAINGTAGEFNDGVATVITTDSAELNTQQSTYTYLFGSNTIAESPPTQIPAIDPTVPLAQAGFAMTPENSSTNPLFHTDGFFTINGVQITVGDVNTVSLNDVLGAINASGAGVTAYYDPANVRVYLRNNSPGVTSISLSGGGDTSNFLTIAGLLTTMGGTQIEGAEEGNIDTELPLAQAGFTDTPASGVFTINNTRIAIDSGVDTLEDVIEKINNSGAGVTASYDPVSDLFTLTQKLDDNTTAQRIAIGDAADTSNFLESVMLTADTTVPTQIGSVRQSAMFSVDGVSYTRNSNTVDDIIDKVTLSLNAITDGAESITVSANTERIQDAILDFIVEYNSTMELINAKPLTTEERSYTAVLTDEDAASMTYEEIEEYIARRDELLTREFTSSDASIRQMARRVQNLVTGLVQNDGQYESLAQLSLTTSEVGGGPDAASVSLGRLLSPTTDRDTLQQLLESNTELQEAIRSNSDELFELFANMLESRYTHQGTRDLSSGISVSSGLRFSVSDGTNTAEIAFNSGTYSQTTILNVINAELNSAGLSSSMLAYYDALNQLSLQVTSTDGQARLQILDSSIGADSVISALGWQVGNFFGPDPEIAGGVALRARQYINNITGVGGIVLERIKENGTYDRRIGTYTDAILRMEDHIDQYESRLRKKFERLEVQLIELESQSTALEQALAELQSATSGS